VIAEASKPFINEPRHRHGSRRPSALEYQRDGVK